MNEMNITSAQYIDVDGDGANDAIEIVVDGVTMHVPNNATGNRHYQAILDWVADGNTIQDAS
jgi:hypothetical protein